MKHYYSKKLISIALSFFILGFLQLSNMKLVSLAAIQIGDVDGNGIVESSDARITLRASVGLEKLEGTVSFIRADYDGNGIISSSDARMILRTSVGLEKEVFLPDEDPSYEITNIINRITDSPYSESGKKFNVIIEVKNTGNVPIYLKNCVLDYEDNDGHLLQTYDFLSNVPDIVQPGEKGYFYTNGSSGFDKGISFDNGCNLVPSITVLKATGELKRHEVSDTSLFESYGSAGCKGRITNETNEEISNIYARVVYYDVNGNVLGISGTNVSNIKANQKTSFSIAGLFLEGFSVDDVASYKTYADESYYQFK